MYSSPAELQNLVLATEVLVQLEAHKPDHSAIVQLNIVQDLGQGYGYCIYLLHRGQRCIRIYFQDLYRLRSLGNLPEDEYPGLLKSSDSDTYKTWEVKPFFLAAYLYKPKYHLQNLNLANHQYRSVLSTNSTYLVPVTVFVAFHFQAVICWSTHAFRKTLRSSILVAFPPWEVTSGKFLWITKWYLEDLVKPRICHRMLLQCHGGPSGTHPR